MLKADFYQTFHARTGWLPMPALIHPVAIGDVCQMRAGHAQALFNLAGLNLLEPILSSGELALDPLAWSMRAGVRQTFCERRETADDGAAGVLTRQVLTFEQAGSFVFHGLAPTARYLLNWNRLSADATLKLTQLHYAFRHIYVVTAVATTRDWALAIAGQADAHLEMAAELDSSDVSGLLGDGTARIERSKGLACTEQGRGRPAHFFKAKKLVISDALYDLLLAQILAQVGPHGRHTMLRLLDTDPLNLLKANELNLTTAIDFFSWSDFSLEDFATFGV